MIEGALVNDGSQNYLVLLQLHFKTFRMPTGVTETIIAWKSKQLSDESIKASITAGNSLAPQVKCIDNSKIAAEFKGSYFFQDKSSFT